MQLCKFLGYYASSEFLVLILSMSATYYIKTEKNIKLCLYVVLIKIFIYVLKERKKSRSSKYSRHIHFLWFD